MHWRAIKQSTGSHEGKAYQIPRDAPTVQEQRDTATRQTDPDMEIPLGHDNAADMRPASPMHSSASTLGEIEPIKPESSEPSSSHEEDYFQAKIPTLTKGMTTFAYQLALQNRIKDGKLRSHGEYDTRPFTPTFIHDCLMLPGSLSNHLGHLSIGELTSRMTPALLPGFHAYVNADTLQPCILQSPNGKDHVQGMVVFGLGRESRDRIHEHYRPNCRRVKVEVEVDVAVPLVDHSERNYATERWRVKRRKVWAHAWLWANVGSGDALFRTQAPKWTIEDYLGGNLEPRGRPDIVEKWRDAEVDVCEDGNAGDREERETVYGGPGRLEYIRGDGFMGW